MTDRPIQRVRINLPHDPQRTITRHPKAVPAEAYNGVGEFAAPFAWQAMKHERARVHQADIDWFDDHPERRYHVRVATCIEVYDLTYRTKSRPNGSGTIIKAIRDRPDRYEFSWSLLPLSQLPLLLLSDEHESLARYFFKYGSPVIPEWFEVW